MPNHIINILTIDGNADEVLEFIKGSESEQFIDFNKILPMPEELEGTTSPTRIISEEEYTKNKETGALYSGVTQTMHDELVKKYGHANWYSWRLDNWGTKWNAYDQSIIDEGVTFQTAWSTPLEIIEKLSELFPETTFTVKYADEDLGYNCGEYQFTNGELIEISRGNGNEDSLEFANEVWGNY